MMTPIGKLFKKELPMSTRSAIIIKNDDNTYSGIYCHFDGYLLWNGVILHKHFNSEEKARELINKGNISSIDELGIVDSYHSKGEKLSIAHGFTLRDTVNSISRGAYVYVFENGQWHFNGVPLKESLANVDYLESNV